MKYETPPRPALKLKEPQSVVDYFGLKIVVPLGTTYLSTDIDGLVTAHHDKPWIEPGFYEGHVIGDVAKIEVPDKPFWGDSLMEIKA